MSADISYFQKISIEYPQYFPKFAMQKGKEFPGGSFLCEECHATFFLIHPSSKCPHTDQDPCHSTLFKNKCIYLLQEDKVDERFVFLRKADRQTILSLAKAKANEYEIQKYTLSPSLAGYYTQISIEYPKYRHKFSLQRENEFSVGSFLCVQCFRVFFTTLHPNTNCINSLKDPCLFQFLRKEDRFIYLIRMDENFLSDVFLGDHDFEHIKKIAYKKAMIYNSLQKAPNEEN